MIKMKKYKFNKSDFPSAMISETPIVYVISARNSNFYKIGYAKNFNQRLSNIQSGCPYDLHLTHCSHAPNYKEVEKYLHEYFKDNNVRGEWFSFDEDDISTIDDFFYELNQSVRMAIRG